MSNAEMLASNPYPVENELLHGLEAGAQISIWHESVQAVSDRYFGEGELAYALQDMKERDVRQLSDYSQNTALEALADRNEVADGFHDAVANRQPRSREQYLGRSMLQAVNPLNEDSRFPGMRPYGFEITEAQKPVMAMVVLDGSFLPSTYQDGGIKGQLLDRVNQALLQAIKGEEFTLTPEMQDILGSCLITKDTSIGATNEEGDPVTWDKPFDQLAGLKALAVLLSGQEHSGYFRQGAVRAPGTELIVGCSGLNSAIDEMVARNFATDVLAQQAAA